MTTKDTEAIAVLTKFLETIDKKNDQAHGEIKERIDCIAGHCRDREIQVSNQIDQAVATAIYESTKPTAWQIGLKGFLWTAGRGIALVAVGVGIYEGLTRLIT